MTNFILSGFRRPNNQTIIDDVRTKGYSVETIDE